MNMAFNHILLILGVIANICVIQMMGTCQQQIVLLFLGLDNSHMGVINGESFLLLAELWCICCVGSVSIRVWRQDIFVSML